MARVPTSAPAASARQTRPRRRMVAPSPLSPPRYDRQYHVRDSIIFSARTRRKRQARRANATPTRKLTLPTLPIDVLLLIADNLDTPSRIALGLTCKRLAAVSRKFNTRLDDQPSWIAHQVFTVDTAGSITRTNNYTPTLSDRRILMLQLRNYMPRSHRLCWICLKYTPIAAANGKWHFTTRVNTLRNNSLDLHFLVRRPVKKVWAHARCMAVHDVEDGREFGMWALATAGAAGGRDVYFHLLNSACKGMEVYENE